MPSKSKSRLGWMHGFIPFHSIQFFINFIPWKNSGTSIRGDFSKLHLLIERTGTTAEKRRKWAGKAGAWEHHADRENFRQVTGSHSPLPRHWRQDSLDRTGRHALPASGRGQDRQDKTWD